MTSLFFFHCTIHSEYEILYRDAFPGLPIEHLILQPSEKPSQAELSGEQPFFDMDLVSPASAMMSIHSGHL